MEKREGATVIKETSGAEINRIENIDETCFIVKGSNKSVTQAMKLLEIITRNVNSILPPTEKRNTICRFYTAWHCKFENRCLFLHPSGPLDISKKVNTKAHVDTRSPEKNHKENTEDPVEAHLQGDTETPKTTPVPNTDTWEERTHLETETPPNGQKENTIPHWIWLNQI